MKWWVQTKPIFDDIKNHGMVQKVALWFIDLGIHKLDTNICKC